MVRIIQKEKLPQKYEAGLVEYAYGLDTIPEWPEIMNYGYSWGEHFKLLKLYDIEAIKYSLQQGIEDEEFNDEEIKETTEIINKMIEEYNNM